MHRSPVHSYFLCKWASNDSPIALRCSIASWNRRFVRHSTLHSVILNLSKFFFARIIELHFSSASPPAAASDSGLVVELVQNSLNAHGDHRLREHPTKTA